MRRLLVEIFSRDLSTEPDIISEVCWTRNVETKILGRLLRVLQQMSLVELSRAYNRRRDRLLTSN